MTTQETTVSPSTGTDTTLTNGRVKWFNNKAGYGFITVSSGEHDGSDVFVHHSAIEVSQEQYRYLIQGEYVEFTLCSVSNDTHKWQAGTVKGIGNGKLMCETRLETRENRTTTTRSSDETTKRAPTRTTPRDDSQPHYRVRSRGTGPREGEEFILVRTNRRGQGRSNSSPTKEVIRSRQTKTPFQGDE